MLRVSEFTTKNKSDSSTEALQLSDVVVSDCQLIINIKKSKTDQRGYSTFIVINKYRDNACICPVLTLKKYWAARPAVSGCNHLFMHFDGSPLTRYQLSVMLRKSVNFCNIPNPNLLKSHSFRIGAATEASKRGINDECHELQSTVWIMGSFIPHMAGITAASRSGGKNLSLDRLGVQVKWITKSGMKWKDLDSSFESEIINWPAPNYIFIHLGANDLVFMKSKDLIENIKCSILRIKVFESDIRIIWSGVYTKFSPGIYDEFIYNLWVDATAGRDLFPRGYHLPSS